MCVVGGACGGLSAFGRCAVFKVDIGDECSVCGTECAVALERECESSAAFINVVEAFVVGCAAALSVGSVKDGDQPCFCGGVECDCVLCGFGSAVCFAFEIATSYIPEFKA